MSLEVQTILEMLQVAVAYCACVLIAPYIVFHSYLRKKTLSEKFIICTLIGNFYLINVVFVIFLLHIPSRFTLYLFSIIPATLAWMAINRPRIKRFFSVLSIAFSRFMLGEAKIKTILTIVLYQPKKLLRKGRKAFFSHLFHHAFEWIMLIGLLGFDVWYYSYQTVTKYVYGTSDLIVHHSWINQMDQGIIFTNGIYPFGFHNVVYFLHHFFGIQTLSILRVFGVIETLFIYLMLYTLLRRICRSKYIPILGIFLFTLPDLFNFQGTMRYQWSLPQEFAMVFLYPCAYFLIQFFDRKKKELLTENALKKKHLLYSWLEQYQIRPSTRSLFLFAISFSLTLAIHFYITIIAVFLCIAIAMAYFPLVFHYRYFAALMITGILSVGTAVAPMGIAYLQGTELEGSLRWAMGAMTPGGSTQDVETDSSDTKSENHDAGSIEEDSNNSNKNIQKDNKTNTTDDKLSNVKTILLSIPLKLKTQISHFNATAAMMLESTYNQLKAIPWLLKGMELFGLFTILMLFIRRSFYYRNLLGITIYFFFMVILISATAFSIPSVMDVARSRIFVVYATPLFLACIADSAYTILFYPLRYHRITEIIPLGATAVLIFLTITNHFVKPLNIVYSLQAPGEMKCNYQIMKDYPEKKWTIVTTTNSAQLIQDKGWHMEVCTLLEKMSNFTSNTKVTIPTKYVFVYVEKKPLEYGSFDSVTKELKSSGYVSERAASEEASFEGSSIYSAYNRYILESKLFYWAKTFEQKYPQEFQVYYEDDNFICYRIIQNEYHLYNFAIDYKYNK